MCSLLSLLNSCAVGNGKAGFFLEELMWKHIRHDDLTDCFQEGFYTISRKSIFKDLGFSPHF